MVPRQLQAENVSRQLRLGLTATPTRGDVDAVAHEIVAVDDDITQVDADAKSHTGRLGYVGIPLSELQLNLGSAPNRFDGTRELRNHTIASTTEDAPGVVRNQAVNDRAVCLERGERRLLVLAHEPAVADYIGRKDGSNPAQKAIHGHARSG